MPNSSSSRPAVVLLSGGLDSATVLAIAAGELGFACHCLSLDYGQRNRHELQAAARVAAALGAQEHRVVEVDIASFGGSALTTDEIDVPRDRPPDDTAIPVTYVPARNTVFLSLALSFAETLESRDVFIGVNAVDYSGYPDCRPEYIAAFETMARLATRAGVEGRPVTIHAPLIELTKRQIIRRGLALGVDYSMTLSCYAPGADGSPCGRCDACRLREEGFKGADAE